MPLQRKVGCVRNGGEEFTWQAGLHFDDAMAARASDVVVMTLPTDPIAMGTISKFNPIQHTFFKQHFDGAIDRRAS